MWFPANSESVLKALSIDKKFNVTDVLVRGFFYVFADLSVASIPTNSFNLSLVNLENANSIASILRNEKIGDLTKIFRDKVGIIRVIFAVSCSHKTMDLLQKDLKQFGVFQKGFTVTPSDLIELVSFEKDPRCIFANAPAPRVPDSSRSGIILSMPTMRSGWVWISPMTLCELRVQM